MPAVVSAARHSAPLSPDGSPGPGAPLLAWYAQGFSDPLGDRLLLFDNTADGPYELLRVRAELAATAGFESALRARTHELAGFSSDDYARVCRIDHLPEPGGGLALVSHHLGGERLSTLLERAALRRRPLDFRVVMPLAAELARAVAILHAKSPGLAHGAIGAERLVVTPEGRLIVTEYVLGAALERLTCTPGQMWRVWRLALPPNAPTASFDQRTDVVQIGVVALAMTLGRTFAPHEWPAGVHLLFAEADQRAGEAGWDVRWPSFRHWLENALQVGPTAGFANALEAAQALDDSAVLNTGSSSRANVRDFVGEYATGGSAVLDGQPSAPALPAAALPESAPRSSPATSARESPDDARTRFRWSGRTLGRLALVALVVLAIGEAAYIGWRSGARSAVESVTGGVVATRVQSTDAAPGVVERPGPVADAAARQGGSEPTPAAARSAPTPATVTASGWLEVQSDIELQIVEAGKPLGTSRSPRTTLRAGSHEILLVNEAFGFRTVRRVVVPSGRVASIPVELPEAPVAINALPWAEVWIDGVRVGDTPLGDLPVPIGPHVVVFRHPELGERRLDCVVTLDRPVRVSVDMRQ